MSLPAENASSAQGMDFVELAPDEIYVSVRRNSVSEWWQQRRKSLENAESLATSPKLSSSALNPKSPTSPMSPVRENPYIGAFQPFFFMHRRIEDEDFTLDNRK
eukprot:EC118632.1.p2 GENE.EC118632.1~~EC118632.1.p2  ORF type:complete len:104 (+),score=15.98 EC118632.1:113-424(+)